MDRIVRMGRMKEEEPHVKYKTRMSDFAVALIPVYLYSIESVFLKHKKYFGF